MPTHYAVDTDHNSWVFTNTPSASFFSPLKVLVLLLSLQSLWPSNNAEGGDPSCFCLRIILVGLLLHCQVSNQVHDRDWT